MASGPGGRREGAGRKIGYRKPDARRRVIPVKVSEEEREQALLLGDGNVSEGMRRGVALSHALAVQLADGDVSVGIEMIRRLTGSE